MKDLIEALIIFEKYNKNASTHCEHDEMQIFGIKPKDVSAEDKELLNRYGFFESDAYDEEFFISFKWGN